MTKQTKQPDAPGVLGGNPQDPETIKQDLQDEKDFEQLSQEQKDYQVSELDESWTWTVHLITGAKHEGLKQSDLGKLLYGLVVARIAFSVHPEG